MRSKPPRFFLDREHERVLAGLALVAFALTIPLLAHWAGYSQGAPVARQVEFLAVFAVALGLAAVLVTWRRWARYRGLAAIVVGSTLALVAVADLVESRIQDAQLASFRAELAHEALGHERRLELLDERVLVAGLAGSIRYHELEQAVHREHMRRRLDELAALVARRADYRERMRNEFTTLVRDHLYARSWRAAGLAEVEELMGRIDAAYAPRDEAAMDFVQASRRALDWYETGGAARGPGADRLAELVSRALAAESAFEQAWHAADRESASRGRRFVVRADRGG